MDETWGGLRTQTEGKGRRKAQQCSVQDNPRLCSSCIHICMCMWIYSNANIQYKKYSHHRLQATRMNENLAHVSIY